MEKRIDVFTRFLEEKRFNDIAIDGDQSDPMVKLLDSVVIFLEGGTDFDLEILDQDWISHQAKIVSRNQELLLVHIQASNNPLRNTQADTEY